MKRMNEVFDLPTDAAEVLHFLKAGDKEFCASIAHAINHVDALADALGLLLTQTSKVYSTSKELGNAEDVARNALAAYRGDK